MNSRSLLRLPAPLRSLSIRGRLLLFLTLSVVGTALAISIVTALVGSKDGHDRVIGQLKSVSALKESEISAWTDSLALNLDIVLSTQEIPLDLGVLTDAPVDAAARASAYERVQQRFAWAATRMGLFEELFFMDREGVVLISTDPSHEGQRLGLNDYFAQGLDGRFIQEPSYSLSLGKMTIIASAPVRSDGGVVGVLVGRAELDGLNEIMIERAGLGETGETYLVGSNYRLLTNLRRPGYAIPDTYIHTQGTEAAVGLGEDGSAIYAGYSGASVVGVYNWIPDLRVALIAEQGEAEALGPTRTALAITGGVAILAALLAIMAGIGLTRRIVRPLAQLGATAGRIATGELDLVADVPQQDEIGTLARAFNSMTGRLRELAATRERQRLARDLHDAVSQTLFSASLIAEVLPRIYERDRDEGRRRLEELRVLTRGALAEMRTLLLELRPAALMEAQLSELLRQLGEAATGRARIPVQVEADGADADLPSDVRVALYYIAHEALNNVVKHSGATHARVALSIGEKGVRLVVEDDGAGFDTAEHGAGQLGLGIMRERAESIGGVLEMHSRPSHGTTVAVTWAPAPPPR